MNEYEKEIYCMDFYLKFNMYGLLLKIQNGRHRSPPAFQVNHEPHQLISQETLAGWNS